MADISEVYCHARGDRVVDAKRYLRNVMDADARLHEETTGRSMIVTRIEIDGDNVLSLHGDGNGAGPDAFFKEWFERFGLTGSFQDAEAGSCYALINRFEEGAQVSSRRGTYFSDVGIEQMGVGYFYENFSLDDLQMLGDLKSKEEVLALFQKHGMDLCEEAAA